MYPPKPITCTECACTPDQGRCQCGSLALRGVGLAFLFTVSLYGAIKLVACLGGLL